MSVFLLDAGTESLSVPTSNAAANPCTGYEPSRLFIQCPNSLIRTPPQQAALSVLIHQMPQPHPVRTALTAPWRRSGTDVPAAPTETRRVERGCGTGYGAGKRIGVSVSVTMSAVAVAVVSVTMTTVTAIRHRRAERRQRQRRHRFTALAAFHTPVPLVPVVPVVPVVSLRGGRMGRWRQVGNALIPRLLVLVLALLRPPVVDLAIRVRNPASRVHQRGAVRLSAFLPLVPSIPRGRQARGGGLDRAVSLPRLAGPLMLALLR
jgi:hypothetical protein